MQEKDKRPKDQRPQKQREQDQRRPQGGTMPPGMPQSGDDRNPQRR